MNIRRRIIFYFSWGFNHLIYTIEKEINKTDRLLPRLRKRKDMQITNISSGSGDITTNLTEIKRYKRLHEELWASN